MKSYLFTITFDEPTAEKARVFSRDLNTTLAIDKADLAACLSNFPKIRLTRTTREESQLLDTLAKERSLDRGDLRSVLSIINFLTNALLNQDLPKDDASCWAQDLVELGLLGSSLSTAFDQLVQQIASDVVPILDPKIRELKASSGVLPAFNALGITVEVRCITKGRYRWGTPVEQYEPEVLGVTPVGSVHIGLDIGAPKDVYFQIDEQGIDNMISSLIAARKEIGALQAYLRSGLSDKKAEHA